MPQSRDAAEKRLLRNNVLSYTVGRVAVFALPPLVAALVSLMLAALSLDGAAAFFADYIFTAAVFLSPVAAIIRVYFLLSASYPRREKNGGGTVFLSLAFAGGCGIILSLVASGAAFNAFRFFSFTFAAQSYALDIFDSSLFAAAAFFLCLSLFYIMILSSVAATFVFGSRIKSRLTKLLSPFALALIAVYAANALAVTVTVIFSTFAKLSFLEAFAVTGSLFTATNILLLLALSCVFILLSALWLFCGARIAERHASELGNK